jgi:hypothetical protein
VRGWQLIRNKPRTWLSLQTDADFPSGADYIDEMTNAMERVGLKPLIQELQDEADEREDA